MSRPPLSAAEVEAELAAQTGLDACHHVFSRWLGDQYDTGSLDAVLSVAACHYLDGDPPWLLIVSGSGNAKTETVAALSSIGAHVTSTVTSEGALLSATPQKERAKGATGGLLRQIGDRGILVIKDFTSIISMNRDLRSSVLAALREVYDGRWDRSVGTDGARTLTWTGRIVLIGAVTTAYDAAHSLIATMGDRFCLVRVPSTTGRLAAGRQALRNVGQETAMRADLAEAVNQLVTHQLHREAAELTDTDMDILLGVANLVTYARTAVERDYQGNVIDAHQPEMPTRFAKMLGQVARGGIALGMAHDRALATAVRVGGDSMPPLRLALLSDVLDHPYSLTSEVQKRLQKPRTTIDRELQALHLLGLMEQQQDEGRGWWRYVLSAEVDQATLKTLVTRNVTTDPTVTRNVTSPTFRDTPGATSSPEKSLAVFLGFGEKQDQQGSLYTLPDKTGDLLDGADISGDREVPTTPAATFSRPESICPDCHQPTNTYGHYRRCLSRDPEGNQQPKEDT